jgi:hypothetical protein
MSDELFDTPASAVQSPPAPPPARPAASPGHAAGPSADDLFDFGPAEGAKGEKSAAAGASPGEAPNALVGKVESLLTGAGAEERLPARPWYRSIGLLIFLAFLANAGVAAFVILKVEEQTARIVQSLKRPATPEKNGKDAASPVLPLDPEPGRQESAANVHGNAESVAAPGDPLGPAPADANAISDSTAELFNAANGFFRRGLYEQARRKYYEILLQLPAGDAGVLAEQQARLGVARSLARLGASDISPIRMRHTPLDTTAAERRPAK